MTPLLENWLEINYNRGMPGTDTVVLSYKINKPKPGNIKVFMKNISRSLATSTWSLRMWARRTTGPTSARSTRTLPSTRWAVERISSMSLSNFFRLEWCSLALICSQTKQWASYQIWILYSVLGTLYSSVFSPLCCAGQLLLFYTMFTSENVEMIQ